MSLSTPLFTFSRCCYVAALSLLWQSTVQANTSHPFYVQLNAGMVFAPKSNTRLQIDGSLNNFSVTSAYDAGYMAGLAVGYRLNQHFRVEMEAFYQEHSANLTLNNTDGEALITTPSQRMRAAFLLNGYYEFYHGKVFTPYITAGIGANHVELKADDIGTTGNILDVAYQVGGGLNCKITDRLSMDVKYRYFSGVEPELRKRNGSALSLFEVADHQAILGVRLDF